VDQISTMLQTASFELLGAEDGTTVEGPGSAVVEDIEIQVLSTIYSCPVVDAATTSLSTSLPTAEVVAPSADTGSQSTLTQGSKATTTGVSTTGNSASVSGSSQSRVDPLQIGIGQGLLAMVAVVGTLYVLF